jgi:hypothetical protein
MSTLRPLILLALRRLGGASQHMCCIRQQTRYGHAASSAYKTHGSPKTNL